MKKWMVVFAVMLFVCCLGGCGSALDAAEPSLTVTEPSFEATMPTEAMQEEELCVYPATIDSFDNLESFLEYATTAESGEGLADLGTLEYFYLPTGLPEGYTLCRINAAKLDVAFYYLPADVTLSEEAVRTVDINKDHIQFISSRESYIFESIMDQFDVTAEDLIDGKYILQEYAERMMVVWEEDGTVLMLYLPRQFVFEDWTPMCAVQKYVRTDDNTFQKAES